MEEAIVRVEHLSHRYSVDWAIRDINLEVKVREFSVCWAPTAPVSPQL